MTDGPGYWRQAWLELDQGLRWLEQSLLLALMGLLLAMGLVQLAAGLFGFPVPAGMPETARTVILWVVVLSATLATVGASHWRAGWLDAMLTHRLHVWLDRATWALSAAVCLILAAASLRYLALDIQLGSAGPPGLPGWVQRIGLPLGFFIIAMRLAARAVFGPSRPDPEHPSEQGPEA